MKRDKSKNRILSLLTATSVLISVLLCGCDNTGTPSSVPEVSVTVSDSSQSGTPPMTSDTYSDEENSSHTPPHRLQPHLIQLLHLSLQHLRLLRLTLPLLLPFHPILLQRQQHRPKPQPQRKNLKLRFHRSLLLPMSRI